MVFLGVYRALYDYAPQGDNELAISEGDLLFVLEKSTDEPDWWKAKKKAQSEDEEEPEGLIPNNYVEEAIPIHTSKALYDYTRQTDEELSFSEDARLDVYDTTDPDWTLVGFKGEYGFAPSNYIEKVGEAAPAMPARPRIQGPEPEPESDIREPPTPSTSSSPVQSPAAALAGIIQQKTGSSRAMASPPPSVTLPPRQPQYTPEESDEDQAPPPSLPQRPQSMSPQIPQQARFAESPEPPGVMASPPLRGPEYDDYRGPISPGGSYHLYNIHEMVSHLGKNKKMPMTLGINVPKGLIMISPEKSRDQKEWTADKLSHYSIEGKHVFMELVRPSKSVDFHAGAKDTAQEIVAALGELAGAARAEGLREVLAASSGSSNVQKKATILYDFMAQGDDEVTVAVGDEVTVLDDTKSEEWWMVRRHKNGKEGVVPSSYVDVTGVVSAAPPSSMTGTNAGKSTVEQNRLEEERLAREASRSYRKRGGSDSKPAERSKRESRDPLTSAKGKQKPDPNKTRTWTDRSGSFRVEAEFLGLKDNKIHLHKQNGVKIAVPVPKMSIEDLEYVEKVTGVSLDDDKPLSDIKRRSTLRAKENKEGEGKAGISIEHPKRPEYDWFDFFLQCGVNPQICERYAGAFSRDEMGEEILPDVNEPLLRTLGLKEGDILRVMKFLDSKFNRDGSKDKRAVSFGGASVIGDGEGAGGLFSGPGGTLRNNTRKGRPAPPIQTNDVVDPKAFEQKTDDTVKKQLPPDATPTPIVSAPSTEKKSVGGFDDDAWDVKPSKQTTSPPPTARSPPPIQQTHTVAPNPPPPTLTGSMAELSLLSPPLQPTPAPQPQPQAQAQAQAQQPPPQASQQPQPTGATPGLFEQLANQPPGKLPQSATGFNQQQLAAPRQRPQASQQAQTGGMIAPPPMRAASAPQNPQQQSAFGPPPLQPQLTGFQPPRMQTQISPPGQSLQDQLNQQQLQQQQQAFLQQQQQLRAQQTGFGIQAPNFNQFPNGIMTQPTGFNQFNPSLQSQPTGFPQFQVSQSTGFQPNMQRGFLNGNTEFPQQFSPGPLQPQATGINAMLPPALQPQATGIAANRFGSTNAIGGFGQPPPPVPPMPPIPQQQSSLQPLVPQKTGPAPPVRFGVQNSAKKLTPQPTGRRANLSQATPDNPFGF
ncbi:hypothetical protein M501DRAFT_440950 [Patellaria atrata CBS 101060]|uniref:Actin cytoskeleton-regulatory complex protein SLA1 n=1 Tax=Patellaria atrata CBS 101060 TaxID=1346257 RepID=A0A9P4S5S6_9PEZI|nr:hypothetical protein M501DRAFT_440950 [Patellaria atrata CBS 101060]